MLIAPRPENEAQRIENLDSYHILDTPTDPVFDEIASLAAKICGLPYAFISLVDRDRQWFKSAHGWHESRQLPRDTSFCGHTILQDEVFHVPNAVEDERFHDNPNVTDGIRIRVYAGVPLVSEEGHKLGALCVLSDRQQALEPWQMEALKQLSRIVRALLKAHRQEGRLALMRRVLDEVPEEIMLADTASLRGIYANAAGLRALRRLRKRNGERRMLLGTMLCADANPAAVAAVAQLQDGRSDGAVVEVARPCLTDAARTAALEMHLHRLRFAGYDAIVSIGHDIGARKREDALRQALQRELEQRNAELGAAYDRLSEEMALARDTQRLFLPFPQCMGRVCFDWMFLASSYLSGDIFDYFAIDEHHVCFHLVDVSGHGVAAALLGFNMQRQLGALATDMLFQLHSHEGDLAAAASAVMGELNRRFIAANPSHLYLTMVYGLIDTETGAAAVVQAGHPHPMLLEAGSEGIRSIGGGGLPVGIVEDAEYEAVAFRMQPGARLFLYSDGLYEAVNRKGEAFGLERLAALLTAQRDAPLAGLKATLEDAVLAWQDRASGLQDDITLLALEFGAAH